MNLNARTIKSKADAAPLKSTVCIAALAATNG